MPIAASSVRFISGTSSTLTRRALYRILALFTLMSAFATTSHAQTQASCAFTFFPISSPVVNIFPAGINDFLTVVGGTTITPPRGFIRWANGGQSYPTGVTALVDRNDSGVSLGYNGTQTAVLLSGSTVQPISLVTRFSTYKFLNVEAINDWGSIVGSYTDLNNVTHGFKRWSNGSGFTLNYPAPFHDLNSGTFPLAINNHGTVVGFTQLPYHGFIYRHGRWTTLTYPGANQTNLVGISDAGVIVGNSSNSANGTSTAFLYKEGVFKAISVPNMTGSFVISTSLRTGLILGIAYSNSVFGGQEGFIAKCN